VINRAQARRARIGVFELDLRAGEVLGNGRAVVLPEQAFQVLLLLLDRGGELVSRNELKSLLWPNDTVVEFDYGINNTVKKLRRALNDSAEEPKYIETIPRRGYRLMVPVEWVGAEDASNGESSADSSSEALSKANLKVGRLTGMVVSHYRVLEVIGGGGMGLVYRTEDLKLGRQVALKFLPEEVGDDPRPRERFEREAHAVSALDHPNICTVYDFDEHEGHPFIAMQLLQGKNLRDHLADGRFRLSKPEGLEIAIQIASGLEAAHEKGIIHRDIKPANIFITEKNVAKILDFGVAKVMQLSEPTSAVILSEDAEQSERDESKDPYANEDAGIEVLRLRSAASGLTPLRMTNVNEAAAAAPAKAETTLTRTGMKLGTAGYMSPEQVRGEPLDVRTDIFSLGLVLYEMATGERAFTGETEVILHGAIQHREPKPVRELNPDLAPKLEAIINKAVEKARERRYQSAAEMRAELEQVNATAPLTPRPRAERRSSKWKWFAAAIMFIFAVTAGVLYWRSRNQIRLTDKDTILIADFQNLTGDKVMNDALDWPLYEEFAQSPYLTMLYPNKVRDILKEMKADEAASNYGSLWSWQRSGFTSELARQVCIRSGSRALITASITNAGNDYRIVMEARDCHSGRTLAKAESEINDRKQIIHTIGRVGYQLRRNLGEPEASLRTFNTPVEKDTSSSLEAAQAFSNGLTLAHEGKFGGSTAEFKRTIQLDPNVALAYVALAANATSGNFPAWAEFQAYMTKAFELREGVSLHQRWFIETMYYALVTGELEKSVSIFEQWIHTYPTDIEPYYDFPPCLNALGQYERALTEAHEQLRLAPTSASYVNVAQNLIALNRLEEARTMLEEAQKRGFDDWAIRSWLYTAAFLQNDSARMQQHITAAMNKPGGKPWAMLQPGDAATYRGRLREASSFYSRARKELQWSPENTPEDVVSHVAIAYVETGSPAQAKRYVENLFPTVPYNDTTKVAIALVLARAGAAPEAEIIAKSLDQKFPSGTIVQNFQLPAIRASIALEQKQPAQAVEDLKPALRYELAAPVTSGCQVLYPAYLRGLAYLRVGKGREAAGEFQKIIDHRGIVEDCPTGPLSYLQLARAQIMTGDKQAARKSYQEFLTIWKDADPDIPIYKQAKAEYRKLAATRPE
jgi:eukaryotic-like serine/threonine-protein kinase